MCVDRRYLFTELPQSLARMRDEPCDEPFDISIVKLVVVVVFVFPVAAVVIGPVVMLLSTLRLLPGIARYAADRW